MSSTAAFVIALIAVAAIITLFIMEAVNGKLNIKSKLSVMASMVTHGGLPRKKSMKPTTSSPLNRKNGELERTFQIWTGQPS